MSRVPSTVLTITGLWAVLLLAASLLWPMGDGYDETAHLDMARAYSHAPLTFYGPGDLLLTPGDALLQKSRGRVPLASSEIAERGARPSYRDLGRAATEVDRPTNQMVQHPPLGYAVYAAALAVPAVDDLPWDAQLWLLRLLSVLVSLPVPLLCWATARRLLSAEKLGAPARKQLALVAALVPLTIPNLVRVGSSVSNDVLLVTVCSAFVYAISRVMTGDVRLKVAAAVGGTLFVALLTKGFALVLPPLVLAAYLLAARRTARRSVVAPLGVAAIGGVLGGLWWLRNLLLYGVVQPAGNGEAFSQALLGSRGDADDGTLSTFVEPFVSKFVLRIWGGIGLGDTLSAGPVVVYGWFAVAALGVVAALTIRATVDARWRALALAGVIVATVGLVAWGSYGDWRRSAIGPIATQGRYIYHLVAAVAAVTVVGWGRALRPGVSRRLPPIVVTAAVLTNAMSWLVIVRSWYGVHGGARSGVEGLLRWAPTPEAVTIGAVFVLPVLASIITVLVLWRSTSARGRDGSRPTGFAGWRAAGYPSR